MSNVRISNKHVAVDKAKTVTITLIAVAAVVTVFSLVVARSLFIQARYINKVNGKKETALKQLKSNEEAVSSLVDSYKAFAEQDTNLLSGSRGGAGERDGDNAKLILDALPSKYDFPGTVASVEKLLKGTTINHITGTDNSLTKKDSAILPKPEEMPFSFSINASFDAASQVINNFERSIRPFVVTRIDLNGVSNDMRVTVDAKTFYQPAKDMQITKEDVK